jgi:hypothetical protein
MVSKRILFSFAFLFFCGFIFSQQRSNHGVKFEQLDQLLRSPNSYRTADGAPGPDYFQQKADYKIKCTIDTKTQVLTGTETVTYHNNSKATMKYIWLQLDENEHNSQSEKHKFNSSGMSKIMSEGSLGRLEPWRELDEYGVKIKTLTDALGKNLQYKIQGTMMRIELPTPLLPAGKFIFKCDWSYKLIDRINNPSNGRGGYELFDDHKNYLYTVVQWFPRLCVYSDFEGWQNKQFVGRGEFALNFGDYDVEITMPSDHVIGATGECQNYMQVLSKPQYNRWLQAKVAKAPIEVVTKEEALANEKTPISSKMSTWRYVAKNVRDFAWTASKKFVWDAMQHTNSLGQKVVCMSYFGKEAYPIYGKYSTKVVDHTLTSYSKQSGLPYPYPVAISVEAANGMEYPMICFNPGRAEEDGTYTERAKESAILVIIHEVGHNYFPMIVNSDERQWAWFDEGINSFMQFIAEQDFDNDYPSRGGPAHLITNYMKRPKDQLEPIMTNSENIIDYGNNAYNKPATALNILRETIMGRENFDYAFKEYCKRWAFKHPTPEDFFRTMEDASGIDLDWFWRGWFYSIDNVDISLDSIKWYKVDLENNPTAKLDTFKMKRQKSFDHITKKRNKEANLDFPVSKDSTLRDIYTNYKPWQTEDSVAMFVSEVYAEQYSNEEKENLFSKENYYELFFTNKGGLVMPVIIEWTFEDGTKEIEQIPVEIWRLNENKFKKVFVKNKPVKGIVIDPNKETGDTDETNNNWPVKELPSKFQVYKANKSIPQPNPMQKAKIRELKP